MRTGLKGQKCAIELQKLCVLLVVVYMFCIILSSNYVTLLLFQHYFQPFRQYGYVNKLKILLKLSET